jgi:hypothetical protein
VVASGALGANRFLEIVKKSFMKIKYKIFITLILIVGIISNFCLNFKDSDFINFNLGLTAIFVSIISLSIADRKEHEIKFSLLAWWEINTDEWYDVKFKIVNRSGVNLFNLILTVVLPIKYALIDNQIYHSQLKQIQSFNKRVYQFDFLRVFPVNEFEYVFEIKLRLPSWEDQEIQFTLTSKEYKSKSITLHPELIKQLLGAKEFDKAIHIS